MKETVDWYVNEPGFACSDFVPDYGFARIQLNGADIMLALPKERTEFKAPHFTGSFYINTNNAVANITPTRRKI